MTNSSPLIQLPIPWHADRARCLTEEAQTYFAGLDQSKTVVFLVSVGGLDCQDLPMSGMLEEKQCLKTLPYTRFLLSCIKPTLGRVCLVKSSPDTSLTTSPLYQNRAHALFYQTIVISLAGDISLIIETKGVDLHVSNFYQTKRLNALDKSSLDASIRQPLKLAQPQLDILNSAQTKHFLSIILTECKKRLSTHQYGALTQASDAFLTRWGSLYFTFGADYAGEWSYLSALNEFRQSVVPKIHETLTNQVKQDNAEIVAAVQTIDAQLHVFPNPPQRINRKLLIKAKARKQFKATEVGKAEVFDRPIFIVSAPRAGSTLLFETFSQFPEIWSTGEENHEALENIIGLHPQHHDFQSNRLDAKCANKAVSTAVKKLFVSKLHDRNQQYYLEVGKEKRPETIRFLEKTPKNALRIPFFNALFPNALFVYLKRDYESNVSSLIDGWRSHQFVSYKDIPGFQTRHWKFLLTPQWQSLHDASIATIANQQWQQSNRIIQQDLAELPQNRWMTIDYQDLIAQPETITRRFSAFADLQWDGVIQARCENGLPVSRLTLSSPQADKWKKHAHFLAEISSKTHLKSAT